MVAKFSHVRKIFQKKIPDFLRNFYERIYLPLLPENQEIRIRQQGRDRLRIDEIEH